MSRPVSILALDLARRVGFAFAAAGETPVWGSQSMGPAGGSVGELLLPFEDWLLDRIGAWSPRFVCYLTPMLLRHDVPSTLQKKFGQAGIVDLVCARLARGGRDIKAYQCSDSTVTKFVTGKGGRFGGTANKKRAVMDAMLRFGWDVKGDDDAGDALATFIYAEHSLAPKQAIARGAAGPLYQSGRAA